MNFNSNTTTNTLAMTTEIKKYDPIPQEVVQFIKEKGYGDITPGAVYLAKDHSVVRVNSIKIDDKRKPADNYSYEVCYQEAADWAGLSWGKESKSNVHDFNYHFRDRIKLERTVAEHHQEAQDLMSGKISMDLFKDSTPDNINADTALIHRSSKEGLQAMQAGLEEKKNKAELVRRFVGYEMEKRKQEMEKFRRDLAVIMEGFEKKIKKIMRVITTIELYLGINEELFQIQDGEPAPSGTTISFRQSVLYMDEEIGHWRDGGLDWTNIDWFDNWLTEPKNLQQVLPEPKGVVVFLPRRNNKDYGEDRIYSNQMNAENKTRTYILIRNGDKLFRVYTENIIIKPRLFPLRSELAELMERVNKEMKEAEGWSNEDERIEKSKDKVNDMMYQYKKRAILLQGLIDRTEVFHPLPAEKVNIFNLDELGDKVQFIYDDEATLPTGRKSFDEFWREGNGKIKQGTRVFITGEYGRNYGKYHDEWGYRFYLASNSYDGLKSVPDLPKAGVYRVEEFQKSWSRDFRETEYNREIEKLKAEGKKYTAEGTYKGKVWARSADEVTGSRDVFTIRYYAEEKDLTIVYMPDAEAMSWDNWETHERKNKTRFKIEKGDSFLFNYDQISLDELEFYRSSRVDRPNYLEMMPILEMMSAWRKNEMAGEQDFAKLVLQTSLPKAPGVPSEEIAARVQEAINWWKYKNQWKRPIKHDDTLALKMIVTRVTSKNYNTFEKFNQD